MGSPSSQQLCQCRDARARCPPSVRGLRGLMFLHDLRPVAWRVALHAAPVAVSSAPPAASLADIAPPLGRRTAGGPGDWFRFTTRGHVPLRLRRGRRSHRRSEPQDPTLPDVSDSGHDLLPTARAEPLIAVHLRYGTAQVTGALHNVVTATCLSGAHPGLPGHHLGFHCAPSLRCPFLSPDTHPQGPGRRTAEAGLSHRAS